MESAITGVLRLYYMTICTITNGKFTIGLYRIVAQPQLYYYALLHTFNQQKPQKFVATHQETFMENSNDIYCVISKLDQGDRTQSEKVNCWQQCAVSAQILGHKSGKQNCS